MTFKTISASGAPYDLGRMIGKATREAVHRVSIHNPEQMATEQRWSGSDYVDQLIAATRHAFPQYIAEMQGMADGMDIPFKRVFMWNCRGDLLWPRDISPAVAAGLSDGCTTLIIPPRDNHGTSQPAMIAHNEDGSSDYYDQCFWVSAKPDNAPGFESFLYPGMIAGHTMGASHGGIVQTINNMRVHDLKVGVPRHFISRAILDCTTMDQALALLSRKDRAGGFHHNLGSVLEKRLVSVEAPASGCMIREISCDPTSPAVAHTNHLLSEELKNTPQEISHSSHVRQIRADELLKQGMLDHGGPTGILFDSLKDHEIHRQPGDDGDDYGQTLGTGIFELHSNTLSITLHDGPDNRNILTRQLTL